MFLFDAYLVAHVSGYVALLRAGPPACLCLLTPYSRLSSDQGPSSGSELRDEGHDQGQDEVARARSLEQQSIPGPGISEEDALLPRRIKRPSNGADRGLRDREEQQGCLLASDVRPPGRIYYFARLVRAIVDPVQQSTFHVREVAEPERASTRFLQTSQARHLITHT